MVTNFLLTLMRAFSILSAECYDPGLVSVVL